MFLKTEIFCIYFPYTRETFKKRKLFKATGFETYADNLQSVIYRFSQLYEKQKVI